MAKTIGEVKQKRLMEIGAEVRALGNLMAVLVDPSKERLELLAKDLERSAQDVRKI